MSKNTVYNIRSRKEKSLFDLKLLYCLFYAFNCVKFGISFLFAKRVFFSKKNIYLLLFEWKGNFLKCDWHWRVKVVPAEFVDVWEREMRNNNRLTFANFVRSFVLAEDFKIVVKDAMMMKESQCQASNKIQSFCERKIEVS